MSRKSRSKKNAKDDSAKSTEEVPAPAEPTEPAAKPESTLPIPTPSVQPAAYASAHASDSRSLKTKFSFYVLLAVIVGISLLSFRVMKSFILPLFLAALTVVIFKPVHNWIRRRLGGRESLAAGLTTAAILLAVLAPLGWVLTVGIAEGVNVSSKWGKNADLLKIDEGLNPYRQKFYLTIPLQDDLDDVASSITASRLSEDALNRSQKVDDMKPRVDNFLDELDQLENSLAAAFDENDNLPEDEQKANWISRITYLKKDKVNEDESKVEEPTVKSRYGKKWDNLKKPANELLALINEPNASNSTDGSDVNIVDRYEALTDSIELEYQLARQEWLGGAGWATLAELANPSEEQIESCLLYTSPSPRDLSTSRMPSSA